MVSPSRCRPRALRLFSLGLTSALALACCPLLLGGAALAQESLRNTFPGRRVGGGTRGECSARVVAHLVPATSVFAPGRSGLVGLLQGPSANPRPLVTEVMPFVAVGTTPPRNQGRQITVPATGAELVLLTPALPSLPRVWESSYQCEGAAAADDPLAFVQAASPPARSLLVADGTPADQKIQAALQTLKRSCGASVPRDQLVSLFALGDVITTEWPQALPVRCL